MAEQIDELFVKLGLEQDKQSFDEAESAFDSLRSTAMQFGALIGGGLGLQELTFGFAESTEEARKLSEEFRGLEVTPQFVSQLRGAFRLFGDDASEAESLIRNIAGIIEDTDWGEISSAAFARGFDISGIQDAENATEALASLNSQLSDMDDEQARRLGSALGLSSAQIRMLRDTNIGAEMQRAQELNPTTPAQIAAGEEFQQSFNELSMAIDGVSGAISETFAGDLGQGMSDLAQYMKENREEISGFAESAIPYLKGTATALGVLVAINSARAGLGLLRNVPGLTAVAAGIGYGLYSSNKDGEGPLSNLPFDIGTGGGGDEKTAEERVSDQQTALQRMQSMPEGLSVEEQRAYMRGELSRQRESMPEISMVPNMTGDMSLGQAGDTINLTIQSIDASNASNPEETRQAVKRAITEAMEQAATNTVKDIKSPVQ